MSKDRPTCQTNAPIVETIGSAAGCVRSVASMATGAGGVVTAISGAASCTNAAKGVAQVSKDPCINSHIAYHGTNDPYIEHMPRNDVGAAVKYSSRMGGESHDIGGGNCEIM